MRLFRKAARSQNRAPTDNSGSWIYSATPASRGSVQNILRGGRIQTKLSVSTPGDAHEVEADRVAESVMRRSETSETEGISGSIPLIQRACSGCESEEEDKIDRKATNASGISGDAAVASVKGGGEPLSPSARSFFEPRFGRDFSEVRVHHDHDAAKANQSLRSEAFAHRNHIAFATGRYSPETHAGKTLLAHELTHVVQQGGAGNLVLPYRNKSAPNFGANDGGGLTEKEFDKKAPDPYIEKIKVHFTGTEIVDDETVPKGTLSATFAANKAKSIPSNISGVKMLGGFPSQGLSDKGKDMEVLRVEGWGYNRDGVAKADRVGKDWPANKYFKKSKGDQANMSYAVFFQKKQAIHFGPLDWASLSCVHVDKESQIRKLNYHTRAGVTLVDVVYDEAALKVPCCERKDAVGYMVSNPCGKQDSKKC